MNIIGINAWHADASAALLMNGELIAAIEEERFTRVKHWAGFPARSIEFCLQEGGLSWEQVDYFAIGRDPGAKIRNKLLYLMRNPSLDPGYLFQRVRNQRKAGNIAKELATVSGLPVSSFNGKIKNVEHHRSHIASAYFASPFEEAACLSIDGSGDFSTTMTAIGEGNSIQVLNSLDFPHSLGIFYSAFTQLLGFPHYGDEYKVMGMAPYGKPVYASQLEDVVQLTSDGLFRLNTAYFRKGTEGIITYDNDFIPKVLTLYSGLMVAHFGRPRLPGAELKEQHFNLAASVQTIAEQTIFHILRRLYKTTGKNNLCLAGGVAQNSVVNGKIKLHTPFKEIYIPSAGHDAGISLGAAFWTQYQENGSLDRKPIFTACTGSKYSNAEIKSFLKKQEGQYQEFDDNELFWLLANQLAEGRVVGWFCGRSEFGPRALGARSILADPRRKDAKELLNRKIKHRESFRPFAPSILKEYVHEYFEQVDNVPFMEKVFRVKEEKFDQIPAVVHVDGSGRLQTVDEEISPRFYRLIDCFRQITGVPILLNTSFNENEPIVNSPADAYDCFQRTDMDLLAMENIVLKK